MIYDTYDGYIITDTVRIGSSNFVLGVHLTNANCFATWKRTLGGAYLDKRPFDDLLAAQKDLVGRANAESEFIEQCQAVKKQSAAHREHER